MMKRLLPLRRLQALQVAGALVPPTFVLVVVLSHRRLRLIAEA
jgi:hypothetical protein